MAARLRALALIFVVYACAAGPSAQETLPKLKLAISSDVSSAAQNAENSALAEQVSQGKHLHGLTRVEVDERIGAGEPCARHPICAERGFDAEDRYYEIGRAAGEGYVRYRPALILGFSRFGKVERTFLLRAQD
jgi:hypothetical protein